MKRILIFISLFLSVTVFGQGVAIRSNGGIGTNLTIYTKLTIPNTDGAWFEPFASHGIGWWDPGAGNYAFWTVDDGLFANTFSIPSLAQATKSVALIGIPPNGTVEGSTLPNDATKFLNGQGAFTVPGGTLYASNVVSGGQIPVAAISGLSPTFNSITGTNMSLYGSSGGAIKLYDSSGNGPYAQLGTNDNLILSNSASAMTVTLTNGGANFGSNVVAKHFYGDGSALTGISGGSATNAVANILTNSVAINAGVITNLNFIPGSSMTITGSMLNGQANIGFSASGSGGSVALSSITNITKVGSIVASDGTNAFWSTGSDILQIREDFFYAGASDPILAYGWLKTGSIASNFEFGDINHWGVIRARATSTSAVVAGLNINSSSMFLNGPMMSEWIIKITPLPSSARVYSLVCGFSDASAGTNGVDEIAFRYNYLTNSGNFVGTTVSNSVITYTNMSVGPSGNTWVKLGIEITANSNAVFYVNGVAQATNTTNLPLGGRATGPFCQVVPHDTQAVDIDLYMDFFSLGFKPTR